MIYGTCSICGCTEDNACIHTVDFASGGISVGQPCSWVDDSHTLCTNCVIEKVSDELFNKSSGALFSKNGKYRFALWRNWDPPLQSLVFIGLNPSTATATEDDPTIRRVISFAKKWGYGSVIMLNLFTYITAYPTELKKCNDPLIGADYVLKETNRGLGIGIGKVIFAWGSFPEAAERAKEVISMFPEAYALAINKDGSPRHPLYVPGNTELIKYKV